MSIVHHDVKLFLMNCGFRAVCVGKVDMGILLDRSGSINQADPGNWNRMLDFVTRIVRSLIISQDAAHIGIVTYADNAKVEFTLDRYYDQQEVVDAIKDFEYIGGSTNTAGGIFTLRTQVYDPSKSNLRGDRADVPNVCIIITDGESNIDATRTIPNADDLKADGCTVFVIGITNSVRIAELRGMSSNGVLGQTYWLSPQFTDLVNLIDAIVNSTCLSSDVGELNWTVLLSKTLIF